MRRSAHAHTDPRSQESDRPSQLRSPRHAHVRRFAAVRSGLGWPRRRAHCDLHGRKLAQGKQLPPRPASGPVDRRLHQSLRRGPDSRPRHRAPSRSRLENDGSHLAQIHWEAVPVPRSRRTSRVDHRSREGALYQTSVRTHAAEIAESLRNGSKKNAAPRRALSATATSTLQSLLALAFDLQLVVHAEGAEELVGSDSGNLLVHLVVDGAVQREVSIVHDNPNWTRRIYRVPAQHRVTINDPQRPQAQPVVELRNRFDRDVVDNILHARHVCDVRQSFIAAHAGSILALDRDHSVFYSQRKVIERDIIAQAHVTQLLGQFLLQLRVRYIWTCHAHQVAHALRVSSFASQLRRVQFSLIEIDRAG